MAHHRRKRARINTPGSGRSGGEWIDHWPAWFDLVYHTRPRRRRETALLKAVLDGTADPDNVAWPLGSSRPLEYYW